MRRLATLGALLLVFVSRLDAQVIERPVPFDSAGYLMVMTPSIAAQAGLRTPWWPVSGDFREARLFTANDSIYVLAVTRPSGVVERYSMAAIDRDAIQATVSRLPREALERKSDARNAFIRNQTLLGLLVYGPTFAGAIADNGATATAAYLVVAGGSFFAANEISRRMSISRAQADLAANTAIFGSLAGWGTLFLLHGNARAMSAGAFVGGLTGTAIGLSIGRHLTEAEAVGAGFGAATGAAIGFGTMIALRGEDRCSMPLDVSQTCNARFSDRAIVATVLGSALVGYPLGIAYPRNAAYNVTPGDIQMLGTTAGLGVVAALAFLPESPETSAAAAAVTAGGVLGIIIGDRALARRYDHSRTDASRVNLGTGAGLLIGAGVAALVNQGSPQLVFALGTVGGIAGLIASEKYASPEQDAGRRARPRVSFNPAAAAMIAAGAKGNHSLLNVSF